MATRPRILHLLGILSLLLIPGLARAQAGTTSRKVDLRPQWKQGHASRYHFHSVQTQKTTMSAGGKQHSVGTQIETEGELTWKVQQVHRDGSYTCAMAFEWMTTNLRGPTGKEMANDSRKDSGNLKPIHDMLKAITSAPLRVEVAEDGAVGEVSGVEALRRQAGKAGGAMMRAMNFRQMASGISTLPHAPKAAEPGKTWRVNFDWRHPLGRLKQNTTYTLKGVESIAGIPVATVAGKAQSQLKVDPSKLPAKGPQMNVKMTDSSYKSQVMFDLVRHEMVGRNTVESHTINSTISFQGHTLTRQTKVDVQSQTWRAAEQK